MEAHQFVAKGGFGRHFLDAIEIGLQRLWSQLFNGLFVHAGGVEITDLLLHVGSLVAGRRGFFENILEDGPVAFGQLVAAAPNGLVWGDGVLRHPTPAGVLVKIDARVRGFVDVGDAESGDVLGGRGGGDEAKQKRKSHALILLRFTSVPVQ